MNPTAVLLLLLLVVVGKDDKPAAQQPANLPLGKETTYVAGPLDKQGYIDYQAALNIDLGRGNTRERNANAALWQVFGPAPEGGDGMPAEFFTWLDTHVPPKEGYYFVALYEFARNRLALTDGQLDAVYDQMRWAT